MTERTPQGIAALLPKPDLYDAGDGPAQAVACPWCLSRHVVCHHRTLVDEAQQDAASHLDRANREISRRERAEIAYTQSEQKRLTLIDRAEQAESQLAALRGAISEILTWLGSYDSDCDYGGSCIAMQVEQRLSAALAPAVAETETTKERDGGE